MSAIWYSRPSDLHYSMRDEVKRRQLGKGRWWEIPEKPLVAVGAGRLPAPETLDLRRVSEKLSDEAVRLLRERDRLRAEALRAEDVFKDRKRAEKLWEQSKEPLDRVAKLYPELVNAINYEKSLPLPVIYPVVSPKRFLALEKRTVTNGVKVAIRDLEAKIDRLVKERDQVLESISETFLKPIDVERKGVMARGRDRARRLQEEIKNLKRELQELKRKYGY